MEADSIKNLRSKIGWSQSEMGKFIGCTTTTISNWEIGARFTSGIADKFLTLLQTIDEKTLKIIVPHLEQMENRLEVKSAKGKKKTFQGKSQTHRRRKNIQTRPGGKS